MRKRMKVLLLLLGIIIVIAIIAIVMVSKMQVALDALKDEKLKDLNLVGIKDGQYYGEYKVLPVSVKVDVLVKDGVIEDIKLLEHINGKGKPAETILSQIIEKQSIIVDDISGATYSSRVIKKAIINAIDSNK